MILRQSLDWFTLLWHKDIIVSSLTEDITHRLFQRPNCLQSFYGRRPYDISLSLAKIWYIMIVIIIVSDLTTASWQAWIIDLHSFLDTKYEKSVQTFYILIQLTFICQKFIFKNSKTDQRHERIFFNDNLPNITESDTAVFLFATNFIIILLLCNRKKNPQKTINGPNVCFLTINFW